jgi:cation:H+ antiporter
MFINLTGLFFGLFLLVKGADILISSAISIGKKLNISEFFLGLIVIGFGTSLCELVVSIDAVIKGSADISVGNVIGSNIANLLLVTFAAGITAELRSIRISIFDILFHMISHIIFLLIFLFSYLNKNYGFIFIFLFVFYLYKSFKNSISDDVGEIKIENDLFSKLSFEKPLFFGVPVCFLSILITLFGADITVDSAISISKILNISDSFIGLTIIALGTSLPEIATSITAAKKGKSNMIVGNIIGSNIYNLLLILGFVSLFENFSYNKEILSRDALFLVLTVIFFSLVIVRKKKIGKKLALICFSFYLLYMINLYLTNF